MSASSFPSDFRLEVRDLALTRGEQRVLEGVSFTARPGEAILITGPNGAGKSTLLRGLAGLLAPDAGKIAVWRQGEAGEPGSDAHFLGHADGLKGALTARENLDFWAAMLGGRHTAPLAQAAFEALQRLKIAGVEDLPVGWLSAGQRRRVALARLLVAPRQLWLLDEPATALDVDAQATFAAIMAEHRSAGGVIIAATHAPLGLADARQLRLASDATFAGESRP